MKYCQNRPQAVHFSKRGFQFAASALVILLAVFPFSAEASWGSFVEKIFPFGKKKQVKTEEFRASSLSLQEVITFALKNHLLMKLAMEEIRQSKAQRLQAGSELLPHLDAGISQGRTGRMNLQAMGFKTPDYLIGPFNTFDARFRLMQTIFDLSAFSRFQAGNTVVKVKQYEEEFARQKVILEASLAYLATLQNQGRFEAAEANVQLAKRLLEQADHQHEAQIATGVDVARANTRTSEEKFQLEEVRLGLTESYLQIQRVAGLPYDEDLG